MTKIIAALALLALTGCFRTESKKVSVLAGAEEPGPRAFSLNAPLVAARTEPVVLSWSPSTGATAYEARVAKDAGCGSAAFEQLGAVSPSVSVPGLAEGTWHLCVVAKDDAGNRRAADNDGLAFLVDRTAPVAVVAGAPRIVGARATFSVGGDGVSAIVYKAGPSATTSCADAAGYSNPVDARTPVEVSLTGEPADWVLCVLADDAAGNRQAATAATAFPFRADPGLQTFTLDVPAVASGEALVVKGVANPAWTTVGAVTISLQDKVSALCLDAAMTSFTAPCPHPLPVAGTTAWAASIPGGALVEGDTYEVSVRAADTAAGVTVDAGRAAVSWVFGALTLAGEGSRFANAVAKDAQGAILIGGSVEGSLDLGVVKLAKPEGASADWLFVKIAADGTTLWAKRFAGNESGSVRMMAVDAAGDVYGLAIAEGDVTVGVTTYPHLGETDALLLKLSGATGEPAWVKHLGSTKSDAAGGLALDPSGNPVVAVRHCGEVALGSGQVVTPTACDVLIASFAAKDGTLAWHRPLTSTRISRPETLVAASGGGYFLVGSYENKLTLGGVTLQTGGATNQDGYVAKLDATGAGVWAATLAGSGAQTITGLAELADGGLVVIGEAGKDGATLAGTAIPTSGADAILFTAKLKSDGSAVLWSKVAAGGDGSEAFDVAQDGKGGVIAVLRGKGDVTVAGSAVEIVGHDDLIVASFAGADGTLTGLRGFGSKWHDVGQRPRLVRAADGEVLIGASYGDDMKLGTGTLPWPNGYGALVLRHRP